MLVREFKEQYSDMYPEEFLGCLPETCFNPSCGSPTEISAVLTGLHCSNPRCPDKIVKRITHIMSDLGVKDFGGSRAADFVATYGVRNPLAVFAYEPSDGTLGSGISMELSQRIFDQINKKKSFALWEYVRTAHLPYIQSSALTLFGEFDNLADAYDKIESGGVEYIREKLGIQKQDNKMPEDAEVLEDEYSDLEVSIPSVSVRAVKIFEVLMTFKQDLFEYLDFVTIIPLNSDDVVTLKAVCSEEVGAPFSTKADFYSTVNGLYPNLHVEFLKTVNASIDYLVWAGADGSPVRVTNKVMKVRGYNEKYEARKESGSLKDGDHYIPIVTAMEFLGILEGKSKGLSAE